MAKIKVHELAKEIEKHQRTQPAEYIPTYIEKVYNTVVLEQVVNYADSKLEDKFPTLKAEIQEFSDGVLIFSITDRMVWNKSLIDTLGLQTYFENNKQIILNSVKRNGNNLSLASTKLKNDYDVVLVNSGEEFDIKFCETGSKIVEDSLNDVAKWHSESLKTVP